MSAETRTLGSASASDTSRPRPWLLLVGVLAVVAGCYILVLGAPFLWDDQHLVELPQVQALRPLPEYFASSFWQHDDVGVLRNYYRPLVILSLALDHRIYGDNPGGFHLTNLLCHVLATGLLWALLRQQGASVYVAALLSALWGLHPRLTEAAAWISGRTDVLAGGFVLGALVVQRSPAKLARVASALLLLLGLLCKETALAGVLAVVVSELQSEFRLTLRARRLAPVALALLAYAALRLNAVGLGSSALSLPLARRIPAVIEAVGRYTTLLLSPGPPDVQIGRLRSREPAFVVLGALTLGAGAFALWKQRGRPVAAGFWSNLTLISSALGLALFAIPFSVNAIAADRFLYLPLAGLALLALPPFTRWSARPRLFYPLALAVTICFGVGTVLRAQTWADEIDFWSDAFRQHPLEPSMSSVALGSVFAREGLFRQALALFERGSTPGMDCEELARNNTATLFLRAGRYEDAQRILSALGSTHPRASNYPVNLALAEAYLDHFEAAQAALDRALQLSPADSAARALRARLPELALSRRALNSLSPSAPPLLRARLEARLGLSHEALRSFALALSAPSVTADDAAEATWLALREADAATTEACFARYSALSAGHPDAKLELAYDSHAQALAKLERAWPTLGLTLVSGG